jgi:hypothetical protein
LLCAALGAHWLLGFFIASAHPHASLNGSVVAPSALHEDAVSSIGTPSNGVKTVNRREVPATTTDESVTPLTLSRLIELHQPLAQKAVLLGEERLALNKLLSDPTNIATARSRLLEPPPKTLNQQDQDERLAVVRFLTDAVRYKENPAIDNATRAIHDVVLATNHRQTEDVAAKKSVAGDKVKLFLAMSSFAPEAAKQLLAEGEKSENGKLIEYARTMAQSGSESP